MPSHDANSYANGRDIFTDPVSHESVDPADALHRSFYEGHMYHFASLVNKQTFDQDPQLWVSTPHASVTSASLSPPGGTP